MLQQARLRTVSKSCALNSNDRNPICWRSGNQESEATMRDMIISELTQALHDIARSFAHFLPRFIVMLILALLGFVIAYVARAVLRSVLGLIKFDKLSEKAGASQ